MFAATILVLIVLHYVRNALYSRQPGLKKVKNINDFSWSNKLTIFVNGEEISITNPDPEMLLSTFIRGELELKGTKIGCAEGGCGACTIVLTTPDGAIKAVNSCLRPLCSNDGFSVSTIEHIGSCKSGLSEEQQALVKHNGTQCGYCTPGWVTTMHAFNQAAEAAGSSATVSSRDIEKYLDGNICRCTGYKPIVEAFKTFAATSTVDPNCCMDTSKCGTSAGCTWSRSADVEELAQRKALVEEAKNQKVRGRVRRLGRHQQTMDLMNSYAVEPLHFYSAQSGKHWYRPITLEQLCAVLSSYPESKVQLVGGNTSIGITKYFNDSAPLYTADTYDVYVDINRIQDFVSVDYNEVSRELRVGAGVTINSLIENLRQHQGTGFPPSTDPDVNHHSIFSVTANHLHRIGSNQVRRTCSL